METLLRKQRSKYTNEGSNVAVSGLWFTVSGKIWKIEPIPEQTLKMVFTGAAPRSLYFSYFWFDLSNSRSGFKDFQGQISHFSRTTFSAKKEPWVCLVLVIPLKANKFNFITYPGVPVLWQLDNWLKVVELEAVIKTKNKLFTMRVSKKQNHDNSCSFYVHC